MARGHFGIAVSRAVCLGLTLMAVDASSSWAAGYGESSAWQFRPPGETQVRLNEEALRLQLEQQGTVLPGAGGGAVSVPLSSGAGGLGPGLGGSSATLGNQTNTTTNVNINVTGDGNDVNVDGYLNLEADQATDGQTSNIGSGSSQ